MKRVIGVLLVGLALCGTAAGQALMPPEDVLRLYEMKEYRQFLLKLAPTLRLPPDELKRYDLYKLYTMKAESQLHLKDATGAAEAFTLASRAAPDNDGRLQNRAMATLCRRAMTGTARYARKTHKDAGPASIDLISLETRQSAMEAMWLDEQELRLPQLKITSARGDIKELLKAVPTAQDLMAVEYVMTKADTQSSDVHAKLCARAGLLLTGEAERISQQIAALTKLANTTYVAGSS